jgi:polyhydroxybutyrate depolymerase
MLKFGVTSSHSSCLLFPPFLLHRSGQNNYTMSCPEGTRDYYVYVPRSYQSSKAVSFVFALHGLGDHALHFSDRTNLTVQSEIWGFILVYPQGSDGVLGTAWNAGTCCADQQVDDDTFLMAVVSNVLATFNIRPDSIHTMGFSNGGEIHHGL